MIEWLLNQTITVKCALVLMAYLIVHFIVLYFTFDSRRKRAVVNNGTQIKLVENKLNEDFELQKRYELLHKLSVNSEGRAFFKDFIQKRIDSEKVLNTDNLVVECCLEAGFGRTNIPIEEMEKLIQSGNVDVAIILLLNSYFDHQSANAFL